MNVRVDKKIFIKQLNKIKDALPGCYAQFVKQYLPNVKTTQIYSVNAGSSINWSILAVMAFVAKRKIDVPENINLDLPSNIEASEVINEFTSVV